MNKELKTRLSVPRGFRTKSNGNMNFVHKMEPRVLTETPTVMTLVQQGRI